MQFIHGLSCMRWSLLCFEREARLFITAAKLVLRRDVGCVSVLLHLLCGWSSLIFDGRWSIMRQGTDRHEVLGVIDVWQRDGKSLAGSAEVLASSKMD